MESEKDFLKYLIDCCENMLESKQMVGTYGLIPPMLQLAKLRAEVTARLEGMGVKHGKFANKKHLLAH